MFGILNLEKQNELIGYETNVWNHFISLMTPNFRRYATYPGAGVRRRKNVDDKHDRTLKTVKRRYIVVAHDVRNFVLKYLGFEAKTNFVVFVSEFFGKSRKEFDFLDELF